MAAPTWGDAVRVKEAAAARFRPGDQASVYAVNVVDTAARAEKLGVVIGETVLGIEFTDGSDVELPAALVDVVVSPELECIEAHDAVVESIALTRHGEVRIAFSHLPVYLRESSSSCGVWSYRAEARIIGVTSFAIEGDTPRHDAESLHDFILLDANGRSVDIREALRDDGVELSWCELRWAVSGARAAFRGGQLTLVLGDQVRRVETFVGELS